MIIPFQRTELRHNPLKQDQIILPVLNLKTFQNVTLGIGHRLLNVSFGCLRSVLTVVVLLMKLLLRTMQSE